MADTDDIPARRARTWQRVDHLRAMPKDAMTDWEWGFLDSLHAKRQRHTCRDRVNLTAKQTAVVDRLWAKHCSSPLYGDTP